MLVSFGRKDIRQNPCTCQITLTLGTSALLSGGLHVRESSFPHGMLPSSKDALIILHLSCVLAVFVAYVFVAIYNRM